ncbi:MAG: DUF3108 domain-containing protein [Thermodesulfobacteriota bacterium]
MKKMVPSTILLLWLIALPHTLMAAASCPLGEVDPAVAAVAYRGAERLSYEISWSDGPKIGEMHLEIRRLSEMPERYELRARVQDSGLFNFFYPVDDTFVTVVEGENRLPVSYEVQQKEGRSYEAKRYTEYDQENGLVRYRKNDLEPEEYQVDGQVHNEFSSFFFSRVMKMVAGQEAIVPTFADRKRHQVVVRNSGPFRAEGTLLGDVDVIEMAPILKFKGLYSKDGDTVIWLTDDLCRVPVRIESKILIGSLTADLVFYSNPNCVEHPGRHGQDPHESTEETDLGLGD